jgi:SnoaL-like domain
VTATTPTDGIRRTIAQYCQLCDDGRFDEWIDLFTADARFHVMGRTHQGHEAIVGFMRVGQSEDQRGRHATFESVIDLSDDGRTTRTWTDYLFVDKSRSVTSVGRYHDELVQGDDGRWRFTLREIVFLGRAPELARPTPA